MSSQHDDADQVMKLEKIYSRKFAPARNKVYAALPNLKETEDIKAAPEHSLKLAIAGYKPGSPTHADFEQARDHGREFLQHLLKHVTCSHVAPGYLEDSGLARALNVFHFVAPLEVLDWMAVHSEDRSAVQSWADIFSRADMSVACWQFWKHIASPEGWARTTPSFLRPNTEGVLPNRMNVFNTRDLAYLDAQEQTALSRN